MNFYVLTLFPEAIINGLSHSMVKRAMDNHIIHVECIDIRTFAGNKHNSVDDYPYGGGAGMVMQAPPVYEAYLSVKNKLPQNTKVVYMTPQGKRYDQKTAQSLSKEENLIILCGHYEGIDERVIEEIVDIEISIGDFILSGGEIPAMMVIDSIARLIPGVLGKEESHQNESFEDDLLEYPQYTRPQVFMGKKVPDVLLSGDHKKIDDWRKEQSILRTKNRRPDLMES